MGHDLTIRLPQESAGADGRGEDWDPDWVAVTQDHFQPARRRERDPAA
jgi:hypothetical protein